MPPPSCYNKSKRFYHRFWDWAFIFIALFSTFDTKWCQCLLTNFDHDVITLKIILCYFVATASSVPPICSVRGLINRTTGCCEGDKCFIEIHETLCFCGRSCHDKSKSDKCCDNIMDDGCYRKFLFI